MTLQAYEAGLRSVRNAEGKASRAALKIAKDEHRKAEETRSYKTIMQVRDWPASGGLGHTGDSITGRFAIMQSWSCQRRLLKRIMPVVGFEVV